MNDGNQVSHTDGHEGMVFILQEVRVKKSPVTSVCLGDFVILGMRRLSGHSDFPDLVKHYIMYLSLPYLSLYNVVLSFRSDLGMFAFPLSSFTEAS